MAKVQILGDMNLSILCQTLKENDSTRTFHEAPFNGWLHETLDPSSPLRAGHFDVGIYLLSPRVWTREGFDFDLENCLEHLQKHRPVKTVLFGSFFVDPTVARPLTSYPELREKARLLNLKLLEASQASPAFYVIDMESYVSLKGLESLCDSRFESLGRMYFSPLAQEGLAHYVSRYLRPLKTSSAKVLVLDLDNTLWGGIVGEDGCDGILLGGEGEGYLFRRFQEELLRLKQSGVLLAIASKNNEADAMAVIDRHPDMILRAKDFAAMKIGWDEKAQSIRAMSEELSLGLDSFVFLDDSEFERAQIKSLLPQVKVCEFKGAEELLPLLRELTWFDVLRLTEEDRKRAASYEVEARRVSEKKNFTNLEDFYRSLQMKMTLFRAQPEQLERLHQLVLKTNQFNLTCKRYEKGEFEAIARQADHWVGGLRVEDRFGESGVTGVFIIRIENKSWFVENLLLSCRIIGRTIEFAVMRELAEKCFESGAEKLCFSFVPSERNQAGKIFLDHSGIEEEDGKWTVTKENLSRVPQHHVLVKWI
jgi:FkbH-like protein